MKRRENGEKLCAPSSLVRFLGYGKKEGIKKGASTKSYIIVVQTSSVRTNRVWNHINLMIELYRIQLN